jgi:hypothetical protein
MVGLGNMGTFVRRSWGFEGADRLGGGPGVGAGGGTVEFDGQGGGRDVDGDDLAGVLAAERDLLADDHDAALLEVRRCTVTGSSRNGHYLPMPFYEYARLCKRRTLEDVEW